jgi:PadR family transcriptional regulator, regulatory protein PadR
MNVNAFDKDLVTGSYDLVALDILHEEPIHVYGMIRKIAEQSGHTIRWYEGTAYRVLHDLERRGWVVSQWLGPRTGRRRKYYRLTDAGRQALRTRRRQWEQFREALDKLLRRS